MLNKNYDNLFLVDLKTKVVDVKEIDGLYYHLFEDTNFYYEGGGMSSDIGKVNDLELIDLKLIDNQIWHGLKEKLDGDVELHVDFKARMFKVQIHTAEHLMCSYINKKYDAPTIMFKEGSDVSSIEMGFKSLNHEIIKDVEDFCNEAIKKDYPVEISYPTYDEASKLVKEEKLEHDDGLRAVKIADIDYGMCACIHVPSLRYLQTIKFLGYEKTTRGYKIDFVVGDQLIKYMQSHFDVLQQASTSLACPQLLINEGIDKLKQERKDLNNQISALKEEIIALMAKGEDDSKVSFKIIENMDQKMFAQYCSYVINHYSKLIIYLLHNDNKAHVVVARSKDVDYKANEIFKQIQAQFNIRGGGNPFMAQGGTDYSDELVNYIKDLIQKL